MCCQSSVHPILLYTRYPTPFHSVRFCSGLLPITIRPYIKSLCELSNLLLNQPHSSPLPKYTVSKLEVVFKLHCYFNPEVVFKLHCCFNPSLVAPCFLGFYHSILGYYLLNSVHCTILCLN